MLVLYLSDTSEDQLLQLFNELDADKSGALDGDDFATLSKNPETEQFWQELLSNFDADGDASISFVEFKSKVISTILSRLEVGSIPRKDWTWRQVCSYSRPSCSELQDVRHDFFRTVWPDLGPT